MSLIPSRRRIGAAVLSALVVAIAVGAATVGAKGTAKRTSGTIWISQVPRKVTGLIPVAGQVKDEVLGEGAVTFNVKAVPRKTGGVDVTVVGVTLWTPTGTLRGTGSALLTIKSIKTTASTVSNGKLTLNKGTGSLKGHSLTAKFTGAGFASGVYFTFKYSGTYR